MQRHLNRRRQIVFGVQVTGVLPNYEAVLPIGQGTHRSNLHLVKCHREVRKGKAPI